MYKTYNSENRQLFPNYQTKLSYKSFLYSRVFIHKPNVPMHLIWFRGDRDRVVFIVLCIMMLLRYENRERGHLNVSFFYWKCRSYLDTNIYISYISYEIPFWEKGWILFNINKFSMWITIVRSYIFVNVVYRSIIRWTMKPKITVM